MQQTAINRIPVHYIYRSQNHFQRDDMHLSQKSGEGIFFTRMKKSMTFHIPLLYLSLNI